MSPPLPAEISSADPKAVGRDLIELDSDPDEIRAYITSSPTLSPILINFPYFAAFMKAVCADDIMRRRGDCLKTKLGELTEEGAIKIAKALGASVRDNFTPAAGVSQWKDKIPAMQELLDTHLFLEPVLVIVMQHALVSHPIWLYLRVFKLTIVSMLDLVTDIFVIVKYMGNEETKGYGWSLLAMVVSCLLLQVLLVVIQNLKKPSKIPLEVVYVFTGLAPGVAAYRVCVGKEMDEFAAIDDRQVFGECGDI